MAATAPEPSPALALAACLARPSIWLEEARAAAICDPAFARFLGLPAWRGVIDRHLAARFGTTDFPAVPSDWSAPLRLAIGPSARIERIVQALTAAIFQKRIRTLVLKADRQHWRDLLGEDAFDLGLRQAAALYPALAEERTPDDPLSVGRERLAGWAGAKDTAAGALLALRLNIHVGEPPTPPVARQIDRLIAREASDD